MIKRYGHRVSPCVIAQLIWIGRVVVKWALANEVDNLAYIFPISLMAFGGYPRSSITASNPGWSIKSNLILKSI